MKSRNQAVQNLGKNLAILAEETSDENTAVLLRLYSQAAESLVRANNMQADTNSRLWKDNRELRKLLDGNP